MKKTNKKATKLKKFFDRLVSPITLLTLFACQGIFLTIWMVLIFINKLILEIGFVLQTITLLIIYSICIWGFYTGFEEDTRVKIPLIVYSIIFYIIFIVLLILSLIN